MMRTLAIVVLGACASQPTYYPSTPESVDSTDGTTAPALLVMTIPYAQETSSQRADRVALAKTLGLMNDQVPSARRDDIDLEVEWSLENVDATDGVALLGMTGASEYFRYDPAAFVVMGKMEDEPPPLWTSSPIHVGAGQKVTGLIREDEFGEAAQDLDAITRAGVAPGACLFTRWPTADVTGGVAPLAGIPSAAIASLLEVDLGVTSDKHMKLTATLRGRATTGRMQQPGARGNVGVSDTTYTPPAAMP
jgi:hypothetical protein